MKRILLLGTGGTIASVLGQDGLAPGLGIDEVLAWIPAIKDMCEVETRQLCSIDSTNITPFHWKMLVEAIEARYNDFDGFVICHGTDTLAYTAAALSYLIQNSAKPIVITGSQKPINLDVTDARTNLEDSFRYALDDRSRDVSIVFGGKVIVGTRARKERAKSYDAFSSINFPYPAVIQDGMLVRYFENPEPRDSVRFYHSMHDSVCVLKLIPGLSPDILPALFERCACLVIESFGVGGMPDTLTTAFREEMRRWRDHDKLVVITTQVPREGSDMTVYEVGRLVKQDFHLMEAYDMTLESVITKLMWLTGRTDLDTAQRRRLFYKTINHDILFAAALKH